MASSAFPLLTAGDIAASSSVVLSLESHYTFYTDGSLINLGTSDVSMGWGWVQIVKDSDFLNSIATYKRGISHLTTMNVIAAIHNNFVNKFYKRIWNSRLYDKGIWEQAMNITSKLKQSSKPKGLSKSSYLPYSSLPPPTHVDSRDSKTDWLMNSIKYGLSWFNYISGFMDHLTVLLNNSFCRMECQF
ncbi:hypothetical protein RhiirC2_818925 [Rhizophagus irregularis]|uniref:Uncharacterized protein n=1 Tax=Rhizophagus irregularis TaxID=588596 RepID=A0A2N1MFG9_9GLOM|nr:hypothetical protein RhiirC2_818925 [Rhizophagus irregularis]